MSQTEVIWLGTVPLGAFAAWILAEVRTANRRIRIGSGTLAAVCFAFWLLSLGNSLGDYYRGMREYRLVQSLIHEYPSKQLEFQKWSLAYDHYDAASHEAKVKELERIVGER